MAKAKKKTVKKAVKKKVGRKKAVKRKPVKRKVTKKKIVRKKVLKKKVVRKKVARKKPAKRKTVKRKIVKKTKTIKRKVTRVMAKKKKKVGKAIRRIATSKGMQDTLMEGAGVVSGAVGAGVLANYVPIKDPRIKALMPIVAGLLLSNVKMFRGKMGKSMTLGMVAAGGLAIVKQFAPNVPVLAGEGDDILDYLSPEEQEAAMLGYYDDEDYDNNELLGVNEDVEEALEGESEEIGEEEDWMDTSDI